MDSNSNSFNDVIDQAMNILNVDGDQEQSGRCSNQDFNQNDSDDSDSSDAVSSDSDGGHSCDGQVVAEHTDDKISSVEQGPESGPGSSSDAAGHGTFLCEKPVSSTSNPVRPIGGSMSTNTTHVTKHASGDEARELLDAVMLRGEQSSYDTTVETKGDSQNDVKEVHVHLTQTTVHKPSAIALGGTVVVNPPQDDTKETEIQRLRNETEKRFEKWTAGMVKTEGTKAVLEKISQGRTLITITGSPGEGKTTAGYLVLKHLHSIGRQVYDIITPEDYFRAKKSTYPVFMFNDILGSLHFDLDKRWKEVLFDIFEMMDHKMADEKDVLERQKHQPIFILISRSTVLREAYPHLGRFKDLVASEECTVDLTHGFKHIPEERMKIWKYHSQKYNVDIDERIVKEVCRMSLPHGFPHCCRLFASMYSKNDALSMKSFFSKPLELLSQTIEALMIDHISGAVFREMLKHDGSFDLESITDDDRRYQFSSEVEKLRGTYLSQDNNIVTFHHPSVYDCVAFIVCQKDPLFVVENCSLLFLNERVRVEGIKYGVHMKHQKTVTISNKYTTTYLQRLKTEVEHGNISLSLLQQALHDEEFASQFMQSILPVPKWYKRKSLSQRVRLLMHKLDRESKESFLFLSAKSTSDKILKYICDSVKLDKNELTEALFGICEHVSPASLKLLDTRYDLNFNVANHMSQTPLSLAAEKGSGEMLKSILQKDVDVRTLDKCGDTPLHTLCRYGVDGDGDVVKMLIEKGANVHQKAVLYPWAPLNIACNEGHKNIVKTLVECGADVNKVSNGGVTPLHDASWMGHTDIVEFLLDRGADIDKRNFDINEGKTPLHDACFKGHLQVVRALIDRGADVNKKSGASERTGLHFAGVVGHVEVATVLLARGADPNKSNRNGRTPLHDACLLGQLDIVKLLLDKGANIEQTDNFGHTPLHEAESQNHTDVVKVLMERGADVAATKDKGLKPIPVK